MLPPGAKLVQHRDPYAGSLRYHLGLVTPNSEDCYIVVDGEKYSWRDGEAVMFDETFIHYAENRTDKNRIVLFLDIKRPVKFLLIDWVNQFFSWAFMSATATKNMAGDKIGVLNKLFHYVYQIRVIGKKSRHSMSCCILPLNIQYMLISSVCYFFSTLQAICYSLQILWVFPISNILTPHANRSYPTARASFVSYLKANQLSM